MYDDFPDDENPILADLRRRQQKRAIQSEVEEQRPFAKPKVHRFLTSSAASTADTACSSAGGVEEASITLCSAEQPAILRLLKISSIRDVQSWLNEADVAICSSAEAQNILKAVGLLSQPKLRQQDVRPLQSKWNVPRMINTIRCF